MIHGIRVGPTPPREAGPLAIPMGRLMNGAFPQDGRWGGAPA